MVTFSHDPWTHEAPLEGILTLNQGTWLLEEPLAEPAYSDAAAQSK